MDSGSLDKKVNSVSSAKLNPNAPKTSSVAPCVSLPGVQKMESSQLSEEMSHFLSFS